MSKHLTDNTTRGITTYIESKLSPHFSTDEITVITDTFFDQLLSVKKHERILEPNRPFTEGELLGVIRAVNRLLKNEPIDYIIGERSFYGRSFLVNDSVLIPRPETEELCEWIIEEEPTNELNILDIGTGSGCIAITLALELKKARVFACDVSEAALETSRKNAAHLNASVQFSSCNILKDFPAVESLNLIVSNPPYVLKSDAEEMQRNVLDYEPHVALFVENSDPLLFYRVIAQKAKAQLEQGGRLYFEIHEKYAGAVIELLESEQFEQVEVRKDLQGKSRMVRCVWKG